MKYTMYREGFNNLEVILVIIVFMFFVHALCYKPFVFLGIHVDEI